MIGQFGGTIQTDDGIDRLKANKFGVKYIPPVNEDQIKFLSETTLKY